MCPQLDRYLRRATASVLEEHIGDCGDANHGERVVIGQRPMMATPDIFLRLTRGPAVATSTCAS